MNSREEKLAIRFVELLAEKTQRSGLSAWHWSNLPPSWRGIFMEAVPAFLEELGYRVDEGRIDDRNEDEQIRIRCESMTARQRLKTYRQLYALGCRIDGIERSIEQLTARSRS
jgi:hypothetical protein